MSFIEECTGNCDWDELILKRFVEFVPSNSIIADVGANVGSFALEISKRMSLKEIYAIELDPSTFEILKSKTNKDSNIKLINVAVSDHVGDVDIYEGTGTSETRNILGNNSLQDNFNFKHIKRGTVKCATMDFIFLKKLQKQIDACKIDTEGAEALVLKGCEKLIKNMTCLFVEIHNKETYKEIIEMCFKNNWEIRCLKNLHKIKNINELDFCYQVIIHPQGL